MSAPLHPIVEYGVVALGSAVLTCGPHTGHAYAAIAFCKDAETAKLLATGISTAPELLEALEAAVSTGALEHGGMADMCRAAIAKARGEVA